MADGGHATGASLIIYILVCVALVLAGGVMSGLTLGLMSMDTVELEASMPDDEAQLRNHMLTGCLPCLAAS